MGAQQSSSSSSNQKMEEEKKRLLLVHQEEYMNIKRLMMAHPRVHVDHDYHRGPMLGKGHSGIVYRCTHLASGREFASKLIPKSSVRTSQELQREIAIMSRLKGHPNVVSMEACYEDDNFYHIIMDLCEGGDLCDWILSRGALSEAQAAQAFYAVVKAVKRCHKYGIMHRDIKAENLLLPLVSDGPRYDFRNLKLADFGFATFFIPGEGPLTFLELVGSPPYMAPDVLQQCYNEKADVWSLGVLLYIMLSNSIPFGGKDNNAIFQAIRANKFNMDDAEYPWSTISSQAKELIRSMLCSNPIHRLSILQVWNHEWLQIWRKTWRHEYRRN